MTIPKFEKVILLLTPGLGLSASWKENAVASAKMTNYFDLYQNYHHVLLKSPQERFEHLREAYGQIGRIDHRLEGGNDLSELRHSTILRELLQNTQKHGSRLHLILTLDDWRRKSEEFLEILKLARREKVPEVAIHLVVGDDFATREKLVEELFDLFHEISAYPFAEIASVVGRKFLEQRSEKYLQFLLSKKLPSKILSVERILTGERFERIGQTLPRFALSLDRAAIGDFDSVLLLNFDQKSYSSLAELFAHREKTTIFPKHLKFALYHDFPTKYWENLPHIFSRRSKSLIAHKINRLGVSAKYVTTANDGGVLPYYFGADRSQLIKSKDSEDFFGTLIDCSLKNSDRFLCAIYDQAYEMTMERDFARTVKALHQLDQGVAKLARMALKNNWLFLVASPFGMAETFPTHGKRLSAIGPLPMLIISERTKKTDHKNLLLELIDEPRHNLSYINKFIITIFEKERVNDQNR